MKINSKAGNNLFYSSRWQKTWIRDEDLEGKKGVSYFLFSKMELGVGIPTGIMSNLPMCLLGGCHL